ncbi:MAG: hypothetical protein LBU17_00070 [Treponema sp.]|jgi:hypothetical protein|nr:hypothetical protein [Treponema sp.]
MTGKLHIIDREAATGCFGCINQECKAAHLSGENEEKLVGQGAKPALLQEALIALLPPILGFIGGFIGMGIISPGSGDPSRAASGVVALFAAAFITYWVRRTP